MKAVIFDMDGLVFDTERVFIEAWDYAGENQYWISRVYDLKTLGNGSENAGISDGVWAIFYGTSA